MDQTVDVPHVEVHFEEARQFADAVSLTNDLAYVIDVLTRLAEEVRRDQSDAVLARAYWTAALVTYARCFATGKRKPLTVDVFEGISGPVNSASEVHAFFKNLRDKHIAHSVNPFEQATVALMLSPDSSDEREVEGVGILTMNHLSPTAEGVESLLELAKIAHTHVSARAAEFQAATLARGKDLPINDLYDQAGLKLRVPGPGLSGQPRGK